MASLTITWPATPLMMPLLASSVPKKLSGPYPGWTPSSASTSGVGPLLTTRITPPRTPSHTLSHTLEGVMRVVSDIPAGLALPPKRSREEEGTTHENGVIKKPRAARGPYRDKINPRTEQEEAEHRRIVYKRNYDAKNRIIITDLKKKLAAKEMESANKDTEIAKLRRIVAEFEARDPN
ncbi:hypothetical protein T484DRAFT_1948632 [Baffinella frigidus]|nr:hypothetical protein T484DRAFT_1948632 [Cryptophyta sp. CCMP2293]